MRPTSRRGAFGGGVVLFHLGLLGGLAERDPLVAIFLRVGAEIVGAVRSGDLKDVFLLGTRGRVGLDVGGVLQTNHAEIFAVLRLGVVQTAVLQPEPSLLPRLEPTSLFRQPARLQTNVFSRKKTERKKKRSKRKQRATDK